MSTMTNMQSGKNLPYKLHRTPNNAQNIQHKLGITFEVRERKNKQTKLHAKDIEVNFAVGKTWTRNKTEEFRLLIHFLYLSLT